METMEQIDTLQELKAFDVDALTEEEVQLGETILKLEAEAARLGRGVAAAGDRCALLERERAIEEGLAEVGRGTEPALKKAREKAEAARGVWEETQEQANGVQAQIEGARQRLQELRKERKAAYLDRLTKTREETAQRAASALWEAVRLMADLRELNHMKAQHGLGGPLEVDCYHPFIHRPYELADFFKERRDRGYRVPTVNEMMKGMRLK